MSDLALGVDAGVGPSGAADSYVLAAEGCDRGLDHFLHGDPVRLPLPADIGRAVIFNEELITRHRIFRAIRAGSPAGKAAPRKKSSAFMGALPER